MKTSLVFPHSHCYLNSNETSGNNFIRGGEEYEVNGTRHDCSYFLPTCFPRHPNAHHSSLINTNDSHTSQFCFRFGISQQSGTESNFPLNTQKQVNFLTVLYPLRRSLRRCQCRHKPWVGFYDNEDPSATPSTQTRGRKGGNFLPITHPSFSTGGR
ncbi:hypothetical protein CDAR_212981 [Caerostris darwini]|uniref:Uncharacterized protein n=1 Tax=Caerostris darwini TaxID=1538125 RepID=A0AAV4UBJ5_9ARAC|nr:hypothetical protein CDAR_212981 [Caerostris darwini]